MNSKDYTCIAPVTKDRNKRPKTSTMERYKLRIPPPVIILNVTGKTLISKQKLMKILKWKYININSIWVENIWT